MHLMSMDLCSSLTSLAVVVKEYCKVLKGQFALQYGKAADIRISAMCV